MTAHSNEFALKSTRVVTESGIHPATILIKDEKILAVADPAQVTSQFSVTDLGDLVIMPGLVDSHVHINEPGRTEWEGFETATRAAAAGGITTLADMPLNCIPITTTPEAFREKLKAIENQLWVDCGFWGGVIPGNRDSIEEMIDAGVLGFKCFLIHSGIDDFPNVTKADLQAAMPILARRKVPLLVHAELESSPVKVKLNGSDPRSYSTFLSSRPRQWENDAIELMIDLCRNSACQVHIVHLSSSDAIPLIAAARQKGLPITAETCPHYLTLSAEDIAAGDTRFKCAPPIRERENLEKLWDALIDGTISFIVSDHSPCTPELKLLEEGNFHKAWGGISSLQFGLPIIWTQARQRGYSLHQLSNWMSRNSAQFLGLKGTKGLISEGYDADLIVFDPEEEFILTPSMIHHRHKLTPHEGRTLFGTVKQTYLRGTQIYNKNHFHTGPIGKPLLRKPPGEE